MRVVCYRRRLDSRIIIRNPHNWRLYIAATSKLPTIFNSGFSSFGTGKFININDSVNDRTVEQEDLIDLKWLHPHLPRVIKDYIKRHL